MFDNADILQCYRRSESIVPQQALALSNSRLAIEMSDRIAERLAHSLESPETGDFIDATFNLILARQPSQQEKEAKSTLSRCSYSRRLRIPNRSERDLSRQF